MLKKHAYRDPELDLKALADRLNVDVRKVSQVLQLRFKRKFSDLIGELRAREAARLLKQQPDWTVLRVALEAGFNTKSQFNLVFRRWLGITPSAYRADNLATLQEP